MPAPFRVLDAAKPAERQAWLELWESWPQREVHAHPSYASLFSEREGSPRCAVWYSPEGSVLFPFILRTLNIAGTARTADEYADIVTPYGYGGAFAWNVTDRELLAQKFWGEFAGWSAEHGVISEFLRLSLFGETLLPYPGTVAARQDNVVCDLTLEPDELWMSFDQKVRKNVKKAQRSGVVIEVDTTGARFEDFIRIYDATMSRRGASDGYYFQRDFFDTIHRDLAGHFAYFHALLDGAVVSTELVLLSHASVYSFLGGTLDGAFAVRPNDLLKFEIIRWSAQSGRRWFVLGGGYEAGDGIFRYKRAFAPEGLRSFSVGTRIVDAASYGRLVDKRKADQAIPLRQGFFPEYRA
jgi:CelD/BcsL family acetyltransferase involved in cellulose biosynthesis